MSIFLVWLEWEWNGLTVRPGRAPRCRQPGRTHKSTCVVRRRGHAVRGVASHDPHTGATPLPRATHTACGERIAAAGPRPPLRISAARPADARSPICAIDALQRGTPT